MKPDEKRILATIRQDLLIWAGRHRGTGIVEEAMPRFHEIIDSFSALIPAQGRKRRTPHNAMKKGELRGAFTVHTCKTCGKEFRRRLYGHSSKEYCTYKCEPGKLSLVMRRVTPQEIYEATRRCEGVDTLSWEQLPEAQQSLFTEVAAHINSVSRNSDVN